jgi:hypothetical protein
VSSWYCTTRGASGITLRVLIGSPGGRSRANGALVLGPRKFVGFGLNQTLLLVDWLVVSKLQTKLNSDVFVLRPSSALLLLLLLPPSLPLETERCTLPTNHATWSPRKGAAAEHQHHDRGAQQCQHDEQRWKCQQWKQDATHVAAQWSAHTRSRPWSAVDGDAAGGTSTQRADCLAAARAGGGDTAGAGNVGRR